MFTGRQVRRSVFFGIVARCKFLYIFIFFCKILYPPRFDSFPPLFTQVTHHNSTFPFDRKKSRAMEPRTSEHFFPTEGPVVTTNDHAVAVSHANKATMPAGEDLCLCQFVDPRTDLVVVAWVPREWVEEEALAAAVSRNAERAELLLKIGALLDGGECPTADLAKCVTILQRDACEKDDDGFSRSDESTSVRTIPGSPDASLARDVCAPDDGEVVLFVRDAEKDMTTVVVTKWEPLLAKCDETVAADTARLAEEETSRLAEEKEMAALLAKEDEAARIALAQKLILKIRDGLSWEGIEACIQVVNGEAEVREEEEESESESEPESESRKRALDGSGDCESDASAQRAEKRARHDKA